MHHPFHKLRTIPLILRHVESYSLNTSKTRLKWVSDPIETARRENRRAGDLGDVGILLAQHIKNELGLGERFIMYTFSPVSNFYIITSSYSLGERGNIYER
jgi:hypothetical protein